MEGSGFQWLSPMVASYFRPSRKIRSLRHLTKDVEMLVLTRKLGEKVLIGDDVVVTVVDIQGGKVRLAFEAPKNTVILRKELKNERTGPLQEDGGAE